MEGFHKHILDAIHINKKRKHIYAKLTENRSKRLSSSLILLEYITLPLAKYYDRRGKSFNNQGIAIIKNDFVPMDINVYDKPVKYRSKLSKKIMKTTKLAAKDFLGSFPKQIRHIEDLEKIYSLSVNFHKSVEEIENDNQVHLAMVKHVIESLALKAKNGIEYSTQSEGKTIPLSASVIRIYKLALRNSFWVDAMANPFHMENIGIIVNDLPEIPV